MLVGTSPIGVDTNATHDAGYAIVSVGVIVHIALTVICLLKGKLATGLVGLPVPLVGFIGAVRTAKPSSFWARRFYGDRKMAKAKARFGDHYQARQERMRDLFSGGRW
jgi:hypothetical protein